MKIICFLRDAGLPINSIGELLSEEDPGSVISILLEQQEQALREELSERQAKLELVTQIQRELKGIEHFSVEAIGDIAYMMENRKSLNRFHATLVLTGLPMSILQWTSIILWITKGLWWLFVVYLLAAVPYAVLISRYYFKKVAYICPQCHTLFKPDLKEAFWAKHTPTLRKLTCTCCGYHGFCVETCATEETNHG